MSKKSLLTEAEMRRFMGLAGLSGQQITSLTETVYENEMEEELYQEEDAPADPEELEDPAEPVGGEEAELADDTEMADMGEPADVAGADADPLAGIAEEDKEAMAQAVIQTIGDALGLDIDVSAGDEGEELGAEAPDALDEPAEAGAEEEIMQEFDDAGVSMELSEDEIVQEVARRVAKRILKANRANKALSEALGLHKTKSRTKK